MAMQFPMNFNQGVFGFYAFGYDANTGERIAVCTWNGCAAVVSIRTPALLAHVNAQHPNVLDDGRRFPAVNQVLQASGTEVSAGVSKGGVQLESSSPSLPNELFSEISEFVSAPSCVRLQSATKCLHALMKQRAELYLNHFSPKNALENLAALQAQHNALQAQHNALQAQHGALQQQYNNLDGVARQLWQQVNPGQPFPY